MLEIQENPIETTQTFKWANDIPAERWDSYLANLSGHPLQSALWGNAREQCNYINSKRHALLLDDQVCALIRFEERKLAGLVKIAWMPQVNTRYNQEILEHIQLLGYDVSAMMPWESSNNEKRKTVWIDLTVGIDKLSANLDKQWRYGVRRAEKSGVKVAISHDKKDLIDFCELCQKIGEKKKFDARCSYDFLNYLLENGSETSVGANLFIAKHEDKFCAGALILYSGKHAHYMWGGVDRKYSKLRAGEFVQWKVMEWAVENNFTLYDLEGIDEKNNPGVAAFKKKMGGKVVELAPLEVKALGWRGKIVSAILEGKLACS